LNSPGGAAHKKGYVMGFKKKFIDFWKPGWKHPDPKMRIRTVSRMTSKVVLMDVYEHDEDASVRATVASRLKDQALLTGIAENDVDYSVRKAAYLRMTKKKLDNLTNQAFIADLAINDESSAVRQSAVGRLTDQAALADVAKNDKDSDVRVAAVSNLTDQAVLTDLAKNDEDSAVRVIAVDNLTNQAFIADLATNDKAESVRFAAWANLTGQSIVYVAPGSFQMGSNDSDSYSDEQPVHHVTISQGYGLGKYPVTQKEYESVMGSNPSRFKGSDNPVEQVRWHDAVEYCEKLTARERAAGRLPSGYEYRLPTEAEWEFAARGGNNSRGYKYSGSDNIDSVAWYSSNSGDKTHKVGTKSANELGLYDMSGNVWEWCHDWYGEYRSSSKTDLTGPSTGSYRVYRGGGWIISSRGCRMANRDYSSPGRTYGSMGFRVAIAGSSL
jgi:formylglycine-generating enzyme required for sulfatase activity